LVPSILRGTYSQDVHDMPYLTQRMPHALHRRTPFLPSRHSGVLVPPQHVHVTARALAFFGGLALAGVGAGFSR